MTSTPMTPNGRTLAALVAVVAVVAVAFVVVYALTPPVDRPMLFGAIGSGWKALTAAAATLAAILAGKAHAGTKAQAVKLDKVERQTNGDLDMRMSRIISAELDARGLVPQQRAGDVAGLVVAPAIGEHRAPGPPAAGDLS